jgi:hypothetical protein
MIPIFMFRIILFVDGAPEGAKYPSRPGQQNPGIE